MTDAPTAPRRPKRADARRNYDQIVAAAEVEIARTGANASLEEIARQAGVGSATLHRHFPTRAALLDAVFHDRVVVLCEKAKALAQSDDPGQALTDWLQDVAVYGATSRGLASALLAGSTAAPPGSGCEAMLTESGDELVKLAQAAGAVRAGVSICDLLTLVNAVSLAVEQNPDAAGEAARLTALALGGIRP